MYPTIHGLQRTSLSHFPILLQFLKFCSGGSETAQGSRGGSKLKEANLLKSPLPFPYKGMMFCRRTCVVWYKWIYKISKIGGVEKILRELGLTQCYPEGFKGRHGESNLNPKLVSPNPDLYTMLALKQGNLFIPRESMLDLDKWSGINISIQ